MILEVSDSGYGMSKDVLARIFEPYFSSKKLGKGTGLGLAMVNSTIEEIKGYIFVESKVGLGTVFTLYFPILEEDLSIKYDSFDSKEEYFEEKEDLTGRETILLVEDEDLVRKTTASALKWKGYKVIEAIHSEDGMEKLEENNDIQLVVSDISMPGMNGVTFATLIKKKRPEIKIILVSGYVKEDVEDGHMPKDITFLSKPYSIDALTRAIKNNLHDNT